jgi:hypothetical protein
MPVSRFPADLVSAGLLLSLLVVLIGSGVGAWWALRQEKDRPSSYTRLGVPMHLLGEGPSPEEWAAMSSEEQEAFDADALAAGMVADGFDAAMEAQAEVRARAEESARLAAQRAAQASALFHP